MNSLVRLPRNLSWRRRSSSFCRDDVEPAVASSSARVHVRAFQPTTTGHSTPTFTAVIILGDQVTNDAAEDVHEDRLHVLMG